MKYIFLLFLLVSRLPQLQAQTKLHFDGYYVTAADSLNPFRYYLRFYEDGTVIGCSTAGDPKNLLPWFKKDHKSPTKGNYSLKDTTIGFSLKSADGIVNYQGPVFGGNWLSLSVKSLINQYQAKEDYFFMKMEGLK